MKLFLFSTISLALVAGCAVGEDYNRPHGFNLAANDAGQGSNWNLNPNGCTASVTGVVTTPSGEDPVYNAIVYVPIKTPLDPLTKGTSCEQCSSTFPKNYFGVDITKYDGSFTLTGIPSGDNIPIVTQVGKFRRFSTIPHLDCGNNIIGRNYVRLPRNKSEGDIPQMAIATGEVDPMACLLVRMGFDIAEFTDPYYDGRIHMFHNNGDSLDKSTPDGSLLYDYPEHLSKYDIIIFPCEGSPIPRTVDEEQNIINFTNNGGKLFLSHYSYVWVANAPAPFPSTADWMPDGTGGYSWPTHYEIDTTFPKGVAFANWLVEVGASFKFGQIDLSDTRYDVRNVTSKSQQWIYGVDSSGKQTTVQEFTFNTPVGAEPEKTCGKVTYADFHVSLASFGTFPASCTGPLTPDEKILEFMLLDLLSCVQPDDQPPSKPNLR